MLFFIEALRAPMSTVYGKRRDPAKPAPLGRLSPGRELCRTTVLKERDEAHLSVGRMFKAKSIAS